MKLNTLARSLALLGLGTSLGVVAKAQTPTPPPAPQQQQQQLQRVEVTGSGIKRAVDEGALPLEVIKADDIKAMGIDTAEDLLRVISGNAAGINNVVSSSGFASDGDRLAIGATYANLRGIGPNGTLVLLNGRRLSNQGMSSGSVDLNAIPMEMLERVEVLKDGASAIYGTDAIGGVINFIMKKSYVGLQGSAKYNTPEAADGGAQRKLGLTGGYGDLEKDGFNFSASISRLSTTALRGISRDFAGAKPEMGLANDTSSAHGFANIISSAGTALPGGTTIGSGTQVYTGGVNALALTGQCDAVPLQLPMLANVGIFNGYTDASSTLRCGRDYGRQYMLSPAKNTTSGVAALSFKLGNEATGFVEYVGSRNYILNEVFPGQFSTSAYPAANYPVNGPHYVDMKALYGVNQFDPTKPIAYRLDMADWGDRIQGLTSTNRRLAVGVEGSLGDYDYRATLSQGKSDAHSELIDGFADNNKLVALLATGQYNPFLMPGQTQTASVMQMIEDTKVRGRIFGGKTKVDEFNATVSGPLMKLPAGDMYFALGTNARREAYDFSGTQNFNCVSSFSAANLALSNSTLLCTSVPSAPDSTRKVAAVFGELSVPVLQNLEFGLAVRHDRYSVVGGTTNPKVSFKFLPMKEILLRGSYNTGFRAPTQQNLTLDVREGETSGSFADPLKCPNANDSNNPACQIENLTYFTGGNPHLKPEKSKQATLGMVVTPTKDLTATIDYWQIKMTDRISTLSQGTLVDNYELFKDNFLRDGNGDLVALQGGYINAGNSTTKGIDFSVQQAMTLMGNKLTTVFSGTKMLNNKVALIKGQPMIEYVGKWTNGTLYLPLKLSLRSTYKTPMLSTTLSVNYSSSYDDEDHGTVGVTPYASLPQFQHRSVSSYTTVNLVSSFTGWKNFTLTGSIINLLDKQPPFTWHYIDRAAGAGWDPRVADPRGRTLQVEAKYVFF